MKTQEDTASKSKSLWDVVLDRYFYEEIIWRLKWMIKRKHQERLILLLKGFTRISVIPEYKFPYHSKRLFQEKFLDPIAEMLSKENHFEDIPYFISIMNLESKKLLSKILRIILSQTQVTHNNGTKRPQEKQRYAI